MEKITVIGQDFSSKKRTPTVSFTHKHKTPNEVCKILAKNNICAWAGHFYALKAIQKLDLEKIGGVTRLGICIYNTEKEIRKTIDLIAKI
jgi:selenocysteine lyase/cysteine desulfurase